MTLATRHELAHLILAHEGKEVIEVEGIHFFSEYDKEEEDEANWLAATLLLPRQGLLNTYRKTSNIQNIASRFGVSTQLVMMRINQTGIRNQMSHSTNRARQ